jgi:hypothetical protein
MRCRSSAPHRQHCCGPRPHTRPGDVRPSTSPSSLMVNVAVVAPVRSGTLRRGRTGQPRSDGIAAGVSSHLTVHARSQALPVVFPLPTARAGTSKRGAPAPTRLVIIRCRQGRSTRGPATRQPTRRWRRTTDGSAFFRGSPSVFGRVASTVDHGSLRK